MTPSENDQLADDAATEARELAYLDSFTARLDTLDATLNPREQEILDTLLYRAMGPLERLRHRQSAGLLDADEQAMLDQLDAEPN